MGSPRQRLAVFLVAFMTAASVTAASACAQPPPSHAPETTDGHDEDRDAHDADLRVPDADLDSRSEPDDTLGDASPASPAESAPRGSAAKRALLVTLDTYAPSTGWGKLASDRDFTVVSGVLRQHGFAAADVRRLRGADATREGIRRAFEEHLVRAAQPGDVLLFHYSGHGHRITDDDHDEIDGYDEVLVPWDAPKSPPAGYRGEKHLRDDELGELLRRARAAAGPSGDVVVFLDSCHSGTGTRGSAAVRGSTDPIGPPQVPLDGVAVARGADEASGFLDLRDRARGASGASPATTEEIAPIAVLAAARHDQLAWEVEDDDGEPLGSLSWAVARALSAPAQGTTYRDLLESVQRLVKGAMVANQPQGEGDLDRRLFGGRAVVQEPFFPVRAVDVARPERARVRLAAGTIAGLTPGSVVEIHRAGAASPTAATLLARGTIAEPADLLGATVALERAAPADDLAAGRAFLIAPAYGGLGVRLRVEGDGPWRSRIDSAIAREVARPASGLERVDGRADLVLRALAEGLVLETDRDGQRFGAPVRLGDPRLEAELVAALRRYARYRYLLGLEVASPTLRLGFEVLPCRLECESLEACSAGRCECAEALPIERFRSAGGELALPVGTGFRVRFANTGTAAAFVSLLDFMPDGSVAVLYPLPGESAAATKLAGGASFEVPAVGHAELGPWQVCPPTGTDVLKLVATAQPVDFQVLLLGSARGPGEVASPLEVLFQSTLDGMRGAQPTMGRGDVATFSVPIGIVSPDGS